MFQAMPQSDQVSFLSNLNLQWVAVHMLPEFASTLAFVICKIINLDPSEVNGTNSSFTLPLYRCCLNNSFLARDDFLIWASQYICHIH